MNLKTKSLVIALIIFNGLVVSFIVLEVQHYVEAHPVKVAEQFSYDALIINRGAKFHAELADTEGKRMRGLSGKDRLPEDTLMLFTFSMSDYWGIWMKDMKFPIDIVWLNADREIVTIEENVSPDSYPTVYKPAVPAQYVIETNAGFIRNHGFKEGDIILIRYQ